MKTITMKKITIIAALACIICMASVYISEMPNAVQMTEAQFFRINLRVNCYYQLNQKLPDDLEKLPKLKGRDNSIIDCNGLKITYTITEKTLVLNSSVIGAESYDITIEGVLKNEHFRLTAKEVAELICDEPFIEPFIENFFKGQVKNENSTNIDMAPSDSPGFTGTPRLPAPCRKGPLSRPRGGANRRIPNSNPRNV
ncbi:MAG: hypothetical protein LBM92_00225 [Opitutaceae bacterium]|jgi:hypothetical protein|nr:hypothetical protein [Opitutaceae bacterium]